MENKRENKQKDENLYQDVFDSASDGLIIFDLETCRVVAANPAMCKMHGYSQEEFINLPISDYPASG